MALSSFATTSNFQVRFHDPSDNPQEWPLRKKVCNTILISLNAFITTVASTCLVPTINDLANSFGQGPDFSALVISAYLFGYLAGPLLLVPLSEIYGRRMVLIISNIVFSAFLLGCEFGSSWDWFLIYRAVTGAAGSIALFVGPNCITDCLIPTHRGKGILALFTASFLGTFLGPLFGGLVAARNGDGYVFWVILIAHWVILLSTLLFFAESHGPTILAHEDEFFDIQHGHRGSVLTLREIRMNHLRDHEAYVSRWEAFKGASYHPLRILFMCPALLCMIIPLAFIYAYLYLVLITHAEVLDNQYELDIFGIAWIPLAMGGGAGAAIAIILWVRTRTKETGTGLGPGMPEDSLRSHMVGSWLLPAGLLLYGWTSEYRVNLSLPIIGVGLTGAGIVFGCIPIHAYLIEACPSNAASVTMAASMIRDMTAGLVALSGMPLTTALGYGWANSVFALVAAVVLAVPVVFLFKGGKLRTSYDVRLA